MRSRNKRLESNMNITTTMKSGLPKRKIKAKRSVLPQKKKKFKREQRE